MSWISVDLDEPVPPMTPITSPLLMWRSMSERAMRSAFREYLKSTWSKSTEPSGTSVRPPSGLVRSLFSSRTSQMRRALSSDMVIITKTIENIMRLMSIEKP